MSSSHSMSAYFPKSDVRTAWAEDGQSDLPQRPSEVGPVFDDLSNAKPIATYTEGEFDASYGLPPQDGSLAANQPIKPKDFANPYLYPMLTKNERQRLTMFWYHTRDLANDKDLLGRLQEKLNLVKESIGWDFAICGLLDNDVFSRLVTVGLPLAILPRRESTCSHTVHQKPGSVYYIPNMAEDWRYKDSPHVKEGGLRSYAGTQLRCTLEDGNDVGLGSLCVASNTANVALTKAQADTLVRFANMLTEEIVNRSRMNRRKQQQRMSELIATISAQSPIDNAEAEVVKLLQDTYPGAKVTVQPVNNNSIVLAEGQIIHLTDVEHGLWEDTKAVEDLIESSNHKKLIGERPLRAIIGSFWARPATQALVVATNIVSQVFDDVDSWFVDRCASVLSHVAQERILQEAIMAKEKFLRGITHQLRTPIHGVLGSVDLLAEELANRSLTDSNPSKSATSLDAFEVLQTIRSSGRELMSTVNNMLKLNRWAEIVDTPRVATLTDLNRIEAEILNDAMTMIPEESANNVSIFFDNQLGYDANAVMIDMTLLKDCIQPLVLNALQATTKGGIVITISASEDYSSMIIDIEDTGVGIPQADRERIFEAYEKSNIHTRGAGLGLTLACKIAEAMNGSVTLVSSEEGRGSHFRADFKLPGFACITANRQKPGDQNLKLQKFFVIPALPQEPTIIHFMNFLKRRGLSQVDQGESHFSIVDFSPDPKQYQELLDKAKEVPLSVSLVPAGIVDETLQTQNPNVKFCYGPFTTARLNEILTSLDEEFAKANPDEPPSPDTRGSLTPLSSRTLPSHRRTATSNSSPSPRRRHVTPRCLLVDDNLINLRIVRMYCDKRSLFYRTAVNGFEAIDQYKALAGEPSPLNLILLDLQMPKCDGIRACKEIRAFEKEQEIKPAAIFIITGQDSPRDREASFAAGADEFFIKPLALKALDRSVADYFASPASQLRGKTSIQSLRPARKPSNA